MILLIDGYNLLRHIFYKTEGLLRKQRDDLIKQLGYYKAKKKHEIKEIVIVFDAGPLGHATSEIVSGVSVVFSGQESNADDWIVEYAQKHQKDDILLITHDRKLISRSERYGITSMGPHDFYVVFKQVLLEAISFSDQEESLESDAFTERYKDIAIGDMGQTDKHRETLDLLMEEASANVKPKDEEMSDQIHEKRKGSARALSKKEKNMYLKIKKLM